MSTKSKTIIIEDAVYFKESSEGGIDSLAKETFYYQFLMKRANDPIDGEENQKAAEDFVKYEEIFSYLVELGIIGNPKYTMDYTPVGDYGACFTLNISKVLEDYDLEKILFSRYQNKSMSEYIKTMLNPTDRFFCNICGAVTLTRHMEFDFPDGKQTHCLACYPLELDVQESIKATYEISKDVEVGVNARLKAIKDMCSNSK